MGRPDSLGADVYHNRRYPAIKGDPASCECPPELLEPPYCAIIKAMVQFSRITKNVILSIYLADSTLQQSVVLARQIEQDLEHWLRALPEQIRPEKNKDEARSLKTIKDPQYAKKQKLVLKIRKYKSFRKTRPPAYSSRLPQREDSTVWVLSDEIVNNGERYSDHVARRTCQMP
mgnify:CR=1 FL=1